MVYNLNKIILHRLNMKLKHPFNTSFGTVQDKDFFIIEVIDQDGISGFGESVAFSSPWYTEETVETTKHIMIDFLIPLLKNNKISHPKDVTQLFKSIKGNNMAKSAIETAIWDLHAKQLKKPLYKVIGGMRKTIDIGISIGIEEDTNVLIDKISKHIAEGFKRVKIKVRKGHDLNVIEKVRRKFPDISLMVDANSAYTLEDLEHLKQFDRFDLLMIEQPLAHNDIVDHAHLQTELNTPICLDESIHSVDDVRKAHELGSCRIINLKIGRVGGLSEAIKIHDYCYKHDISLWCGGMLEAGIGRAHNIALSSLPQFNLPGDSAGSNHYWYEDIINPLVTTNKGQIEQIQADGIGYQVDKDILDKYTVDKTHFPLI